MHSIRNGEMELVFKHDEMDSEALEPLDVSENSDVSYLTDTACETCATYETDESVLAEVQRQAREMLLAASLKRLHCKKCHSKTSSVMLLPCAHVCTCAECTMHVTKCPVCRKHVNSAVHVSFQSTGRAGHVRHVEPESDLKDINKKGV